MFLSSVGLIWLTDVWLTLVQRLFTDEQIKRLIEHTAHEDARRFIQQHATWIIVMPIVCLMYLIYYLAAHVRQPKLQFPVTRLNNAILTSLPRLHRAYWPTFYVTHEIAQAAIGSFVRLDPRIKRDPYFEREIRIMADGEQIALDWLNGPEFDDTTPIIFTCHGLGGHTDELNMQYLALGVRNAGMRFAIFNRRGCALDMKLTRDFLYLWGCTSDMREILAHIKVRYPHAPLFGVGYSAGSNLLTKYLGETGSESLIDAALSVANSYDVKRTSEYLAKKPFHSFVMVNILKNMLARNEDTFRKLEQKLEMEVEEATRVAEETAMKAEAERMAGEAPSSGSEPSTPASPADGVSKPPLRRKLSLERVKKVKSVLEWDEHFSLLTHRQFSNLEDFYAAQSTTPEMISNIAVPLLNLHALDDPIIPDEILPYAALKSNGNIMLATTSRGGHLGFTEGIFPFAGRTWMESLTIEYFSTLKRQDIWKMVREARELTRQTRHGVKGPKFEHKYHTHERKGQTQTIPEEEVETINNNNHGVFEFKQQMEDEHTMTQTMRRRGPSRSSSRIRAQTNGVTGDANGNGTEHNSTTTAAAITIAPAAVASTRTTRASSRSRSRCSVPSASVPFSVPLPVPSFVPSDLTLAGSPLPSPQAEDLLPDTPMPIGIEKGNQEDVEMKDTSDNRNATLKKVVTHPLATAMEFEFTPYVSSSSSSVKRTHSSTSSIGVVGSNSVSSPKRRKVAAANE